MTTLLNEDVEESPVIGSGGSSRILVREPKYQPPTGEGV